MVLSEQVWLERDGEAHLETHVQRESGVRGHGLEQRSVCLVLLHRQPLYLVLDL